jgi:hypothetical protein
VEERIGLVFSWDPRAQHWVKERGPEDAPPPPADPIDNGAVQTYFLDPQTGRWNGTILGLKGRQISVELADKYRTPKMVGLAIIAKVAPKASLIATPDQKKSNAVPMMAGIAAVVVVIAAGAFAAQAVMKPSAATTSAAPTTGVIVSAPVATTAATEAPAPTQAPVTTPVRTAAPTAPPPPPVAQTVTYAARLPNNTVVTYRGPNAVNQGAQLDGVISVIVNGGAGGTEPLTLYIGPLGTAQQAKLIPDRNGNIPFSIRVSAPKGSGQLSFSLGANGELRILGPISVR